MMYLAVLFAAAFFAATNATYSQSFMDDPDLQRLVSMMEGDFSSERQSKRDTSYFDIRLHMRQIWKTNREGYWFYVEQALASAQDKPYRQRVYYVAKLEENMFVSEVFAIANPLQYAGLWKDENLLKNLTMDSLTLRDGCGVYLQKKGDFFSGQTQMKTCTSDLNGASWASSEVTISPDGILSWDRGWDSKDRQVWGAVVGGYEFVRQKAETNSEKKP